MINGTRVFKGKWDVYGFVFDTLEYVINTLFTISSSIKFTTVQMNRKYKGNNTLSKHSSGGL